jgi:hypothetical protein
MDYLYNTGEVVGDYKIVEQTRINAYSCNVKAYKIICIVCGREKIKTENTLLKSTAPRHKNCFRKSHRWNLGKPISAAQS